MLERKGRLIRFPERRAERSREPLSSGLILKADCMSLLEALSPLEPETASLMGIPDRIYLVGRNGQLSFSSDPENGIAAAAGSLFRDSALPAGPLPDYGIHILSTGGGTFCVLLDKERKIIVIESVSGAFSDEGSWKPFGAAVRDALDSAKAGRGFSFILNNQGRISRI